MAFDLKEFPMPMGFKKIYKDTLSGELLVEEPGVNRTLYFIDGNLESAMSTVENEKLGGVLQSLGKITGAQKEEAFDQIKIGEQLGGYLVKSGLLSRQDLFMALQFQIRSIATTAFCATSGTFSFFEGTPKLPPNQQFHIRTPQVIKDGIYRITDFRYYRDRFLNKSPVTTPITEELAEILPLEAKRFHGDISDMRHHTNTQIKSHLELDDLLFWRRIILLYLLSVVDFVDFNIADSLTPPPYLEDDALTRHGDEPEPAMPAEEDHDARTVYFDGDPDEQTIVSKPLTDPFDEHQPVVDEFLAESLRVYDVNDTPDKTQTAPAQDQQGYQQTPRKPREEPEVDEFKAESLKPYEEEETTDKQEPSVPGTGTEEEASPPKKTAEPLKDASQLYLKACKIFRDKRYHETALIMERLIASDNTKAKYFLLLGLCQSRIPSLIQHAEKNLQRAADMEPWNADPVFYMGELFQSQKMPKRAEKYFKMALEINMEHTLAGNRMKQLDKNKTTFLSSFFSKKS